MLTITLKSGGASPVADLPTSVRARSDPCSETIEHESLLPEPTCSRQYFRTPPIPRRWTRIHRSGLSGFMATPNLFSQLVLARRAENSRH